MNALIISLYLGYALYETFPFRNDIIKMGGSSATDSIIAIVLYIVAVVGSQYLLRRLGVSTHMRRGLPSIVIGLLIVGFVLALCYQVFAITHIIPTLPVVLNQVFGPTQYFFWWFVGPLVGLFFLA